MKVNSRRAANHGRYIYAYKHIRTRQVLYSFDRVPSSTIINKQLPDLGSNSRPPKIRRDLWQPLFTLIYPESTHGYQRGLDAFRKLREWRLMHEYHDEHPAESYRKRDKAELKELQDIIDRRGGNKGESVYDMVQRQNRSLRVRNIMDQHANSVADLAAVLLEQEKLAIEDAEHQKSLKSWEIVPKTLPKADRGLALIRRYERRIAELEEMKSKMPVRWRAGVDGNISPGGIRARLHELKARLASAISAVPLIEEIREGLRAKLIEARKEGSSEEIPKALKALDLKSTTLSIKPMMDKVNPGARREALVRLRQLVKPIESLEGVIIKWQDPFDSEFAAAWPEQITHEPMGIVDKISPLPDLPPLLDTIDLQRKAAIYSECRKILRQPTLEQKQAAVERCKLITLGEDGKIEIEPVVEEPEEEEIIEFDEVEENDDEDIMPEATTTESPEGKTEQKTESGTTATERQDAKNEIDELEEQENETEETDADDAEIRKAIAIVGANPRKTKSSKGKTKVPSQSWKKIFKHLEGSSKKMPIHATISSTQLRSSTGGVRASSP